MAPRFLGHAVGWVARLLQKLETPHEDGRYVDLSPGHAVRGEHLGSPRAGVYQAGRHMGLESVLNFGAKGWSQCIKDNSSCMVHSIL